MRYNYGNLNMILANFVRNSALVDEDIYHLSPDEKILIENNIIPQVNPAIKTSLLGEGKTAKVYKVLFDGNLAAAKVSKVKSDITAVYKLYLIKKKLQQNSETKDLAKHIMEFYGSYQGDVVEKGEKVTKYIAVTELLETPGEDISTYFAYSNLVKTLPEDVRITRYFSTVEDIFNSIKKHFNKAKIAYQAESTGVYYDLIKYCYNKNIDCNKDNLKQASQEINLLVTEYLNKIENKTFTKIESLKESIKGTALPLEMVIKTNLLHPIESKFINRTVPKFFEDVFYDESASLVNQIINVLIKYNFQDLAKDISNLLEPLIMKSLEIFLTGINLSYKSKIQTLRYFEHVKELSSFVRLLNYLVDNNLANYDDIHHFNVMIRNDGTLVLSDPGSFEFL